MARAVNNDLLPQSFEGKLAHVIEECAEVTKAIIKLKRFGDEPHAYGGVIYDNIGDLRREVADLRAALTRLDGWLQ